MRPRVGQMLASTVDTTAVVVVRCPDSEVDITCGGAAMAEANGPGPAATATGTADPGLMGGSLLGKRYADEDLGLELLCTKQGEGTLAANGVPLPMKSAKPLPASD